MAEDQSFGAASATGRDSSPAGGARFSGMDALRSAAMFVGVLYHAVRGMDAESDGSGRTVLARLMGWVHTFRMPLFFLISGFFSGMMWSRYAAAGYFRKRWLRIGASLGCFWMLTAAAHLCLGVDDGTTAGMEMKAPIAFALFKGDAIHFKMRHLWFLWYLLLFTTGTPLLVSNTKIHACAARVFDRLRQILRMPFWLAFASWVALGAWLGLFLAGTIPGRAPVRLR